MKTRKKYSLIAFLSLFTGFSYAQTLNWANVMDENKHIVNLNFGLSYSVNYGLSYSYRIPNKRFLTLATFDFSMPSGSDAFDDFKIRIGNQTRWFSVGGFQFSTKLYGIYRQITFDNVRLRNFGSELSGTIGYYRPKWFLAADLGFDKAIATHFKHGTMYKTHFENVQDGWYEPATGGNFNYGLHAGFSLKRTDMYLKVGKIITQDFKTKPFLPIYAELGVTRRL